MADWTAINARIGSARRSADPIDALLRLFAECTDGHVAMALGREYESGSQWADADRWYGKAEALYPMQSYRQQAQRARTALRARHAAAAQAPGPALSPDQFNREVLHVVSCSRQKAWDDPNVRNRFLPASQAYQGSEIRAWLRDPRSTSARWLILSAKHGFIEPDQPISNYDVTFNDLATGPITDDALRRQVEHQRRWADRVPLAGFRKVVVHGSLTYLQRVKAAFASTGASVSLSGVNSSADPGAPQTAVVRDGDRIEAVGKALAALPAEVYNRLDCAEPEWPVLKELAKPAHQFRVLAVLAFGLCDYQLGAGGAAAYWVAIQKHLRSRPIATSEQLLAFIRVLSGESVASRLADQKIERVKRLLQSDLPAWCESKSIEQLGSDSVEFWTLLAAAMNQARDAKTIVFAMKCFDLLHKVATGRHVAFEGAPIIVDLRIARISLAAGLLRLADHSVASAMQDGSGVASLHHDAIIEAWNGVQRAANGLSLFRIDSLVWQLADPIYAARADRVLAMRQAAALLERAGAEPRLARAVASELTAAL